MIMDELKQGRFLISEGVICETIPLARLDDIQAEIRRQLEADMNRNRPMEIIVREIGRAAEFFTENKWVVSFLNPTRLLLGAPFVGKVMKMPKGGRERDDDQYVDTKVYIPSGWLVVEINVSNDFPRINTKYWLLSRTNSKTLKESFLTNSDNFYTVHPHVFRDGGLCSGLISIRDFDIDKIASIMKSGVEGTGVGTSIWDYNPSSPATQITDCIKGYRAFKLHSEGKGDDEIWDILRTPTPNEETDDEQPEDEEEGGENNG